MWINLSVLNVKDNGFITTLISDVSLAQIGVYGILGLIPLPVKPVKTDITDRRILQKDEGHVLIVMETSF